MAEIVILGSGCGFATTTRFANSIALLTGREFYLFECGEPAAALLFRNGIDALALRAVFISHMHHDHAGGLGGLISSCQLASRTTKRKFKPWSITRYDAWYRGALHFPPPDPSGAPLPESRPPMAVLMPAAGIDAMRGYLEALYLAPEDLNFELGLAPVSEGLTYDDGVIKVEAVANTHLSGNFAYDKYSHQGRPDRLASYSFAAEVEGQRIVFSGDIGGPEELAPLLPGASTLVIEMAHHEPEKLGPFLRELPLKHIILTHIHPGLEDQLPALLAAWADPRIQIAHDGFRLPLGEN